MATELEDLKVLQSAEQIADAIWTQVARWNEFAKGTVGTQLARAADSVGANIAESFGRFNYGEKLQFLYYARGSLFETKYWLNRAKTRELMANDVIRAYAEELTNLARQLNMFASSIKAQRAVAGSHKVVRELVSEYSVNSGEEIDAGDPLFTLYDLEWLED